MKFSNAAVAAPTPEQWQRVAQLHILFAHQSVGGNLIDGIQSLVNEQHIPLLISETRTPLAGPGIQHFKVGHNEDPEGKLNDFRTTFDAIVDGAADADAQGADAATNAAATSAVTTSNATIRNGAPIDIAMLKFCFIDFTSNVDPQQLAQHYIHTLDELARAHPQTRFVPVTSPLTTVQSGPRAWLKKLLGKEPGGYASNARRFAFNQVLRAHYGERLFDLAALESDRGRNHVDVQGQAVEVLNPALTEDGGHLNAGGERLFGGALIAHLADVAQSPTDNTAVDRP